MPPEELLDSINRQYPCRRVQLQQLSILIGTVRAPPRPPSDDCSLAQESFPSPQAFVVHGLPATGKSSVLQCLLERLGTSFFWVPCHECITTRQLLERI